MNNKVMLGIDQSTSGTKVVLVDKHGEIILKKVKEHKQYYPKVGWVEHDPMEIYENTVALLKEVINESTGHEIIGLSITNQRETILFWDKITGKPLCKALVWQCRRGVSICEDLSDQGYEKMVEEKTGLKLDTYFSASKIKWAIDNDAEVKKAALRGTLSIGTVDTWLIFKLTAGKVFATDYTNASRTMLFNINTLDWDEELLQLFSVKRGMLPHIKSSNDIYGYVDEQSFPFIKKMQICGVIGDSQGALFGQQCFIEGMAKATYGTGSSIMMYTGERQVNSKNGLVTSVAWGIDGKVKFAVEGIINSSGDTLKWVKDNLGLYEADDEVHQLISSLDSNEGVYIVPAFVGLGAPYWQPNVKASIVGLSRKSSKAHIVRAAVESMAYQIYDLADVMEKDSGLSIEQLNADGGPTRNAFLMQLQANLLNTPVQCSVFQEYSVLGAVFIGGLGLNLWQDLEELNKLRNYANRYHPKNEDTKVLIEGWKKAVASAISNS